ncbi:MAG: epoxyqueuosine reductase [Chloroflexota bacterium]|nr:epoxyqueuosine reductase [Chloroflexota bacterium]
MRQDELISDPAALIENEIKRYVATSPNNLMPSHIGGVIWDEPVVRFADGDDAIFQEYKTIVGDFHVAPREALETHLAKVARGYHHPQKVSVISWVLPATLETRRSLRRETQVCSLRWNYTRWYGQETNFRLARHLVVMLEDMGFHAVAPELESWFEVRRDVANGPASRWSQRHVAYAAGLGTFGLNDGFITPKGIAVRIGSVVCDLAIPASPRPYADHTANCRFFRDGACGRCIERCPADAISEKGHDKAKCSDYMSNVMPRVLEELGRGAGYVGRYLGCGFCQTGTPCEAGIPPVKRSRRHPDTKAAVS